MLTSLVTVWLAGCSVGPAVSKCHEISFTLVDVLMQIHQVLHGHFDHVNALLSAQPTHSKKHTTPYPSRGWVVDFVQEGPTMVIISDLERRHSIERSLQLGDHCGRRFAEHVAHFH